MKRLKREYCSICRDYHIPGGAHVFGKSFEGVRYVASKPKAQSKRPAVHKRPVNKPVNKSVNTPAVHKAKPKPKPSGGQEARREYRREWMRKKRAAAAAE